MTHPKSGIRCARLGLALLSLLVGSSATAQQQFTKAGDPIAPSGEHAPAAVEYRALLIANDQMVGDNDKVETAMKNWNSWKTGTITKEDSLTGPQIVTAINTWVPTIDSDDVAVFYYAGHGGMIADAAGGGADETKGTDSVADNDGHRFYDEIIGKDMDPDTEKIEFGVAFARDDEIGDALGNLPLETTLLAIFNMCHANGKALGTSDVDTLPYTAVLTSCPEAGESFYTDGNGYVWTNKVVKGLFDGPDGNLTADADGDGNGKITAQELANYAEAQDSATDFTSDLWGPFDRPIFTGLNNEQTAPGDQTGNKKGGEDGSGVCSNPDCGDLPDSYKTLISSHGPCYNEFKLQYLGATVDSEEDGQPSSYADGDDTDTDGDDDDGVVFGSSFVEVTITVNHPDPHDYRLDAWWDLNHNGMFDEPSEHVIDSTVVYNGSSGGLHEDLTTGSYVKSYTNLGFDPRNPNSRFRLTFGIPTSTTIHPVDEYDAGDGGSHGEVEDYHGAHAIPTFSQRGVIAFGILLLTVMAWTLRRRRTA